MSCHPCADHYGSCDHCALCDGLGVCCATVPGTVPRVADVVSRQYDSDILRRVIVEEFANQPGLLALITTEGRPEASAQSSVPAVAAFVDGPCSCAPRALPVASAPIDIVCRPASVSEAEKEPARVQP
jgi:hypothetical protein